MSSATWGGRCPYCGEPFRGLKDGKTIGSHKTPWYPFGRDVGRERCPYSGGTLADARKRITPRMRRMQAHIVETMRISGEVLPYHYEQWLTKRGLLAETLDMIKKARGES